MSESYINLGICTDNEEADVLEAERLSFSETGSIQPHIALSVVVQN